MILTLPRVPAALFAASFVFPVYYTALSFVLHVRRPQRPAAVTQRASRPRPPCRRGRLRRAGRRRGVRRDVAAAAGLRRAPPDPRRRRHVVSRGGRPALVPDGRAPPRRAARRDSRAPAARLHRDRGSPVLRASGRRSHRARPRGREERPRAGHGRGRQHADAAARPDALPVEQEDVRPQGSRGGARADDRRAAEQGAGARALSQSHLSERRRLRRRDDVAPPLRPAGQAAEPRRVRAHRRPRARAVDAVAVVEPRRRARAQPRRLDAGCARRDSSPRPRSGRRDGRASASGRIPARAIRAAATRRSSCASRSASGSAATIRRTGKSARRSCRRCRRPPSRPCAAGWRGSTSPSCRRRSSRSIRARATSWRSSAGATSRSRSSTARSRSRRQPGSAFKPLLFAAALENGYSPVSLIDGLTTIAPQGPDEWAPRNADGETPDVLTLRAALLESNNRAASALQQRVGSRPVLRLASHVGLHDMPDVPSLSLGTGLVTPARADGGVCDVPERRAVHRAARDRARARRRRRRGARQPDAERARPVGADRLPDGVDARRRRRSRHGLGRAARRTGLSGRRARPGRPTTSRTRGSSGSRRTWSSASGSGSISRRRSAATPTGRAMRRRSGPTSCAAPRARARPRPSTRRLVSRKRRSAASRISGRSKGVRLTPSTSSPTTRCRAASARSTAAASSSRSGARSRACCRAWGSGFAEFSGKGSGTDDASSPRLLLAHLRRHVDVLGRGSGGFSR